MFWGKTAQQLTDIERALLAQEVQHLKMQEGETVAAETVTPEQESGWTRFVEGFREGWNEKIAVEDNEDRMGNRLPARDPITGEILRNSFFPFWSIPKANEYTHPQYEYYWGNHSNRK